MWTQRVKSEIKFTAPDGQTFSALWIGNERSQSKKIGTFDIPNFDGVIIQDLGVGGVSYPLTVYFEGLNHDKTAESFSKAFASNRDRWTVNHPTKGKKLLQPISWSENISPVENGNYTIFETEWLEPADEKVLESEPNLFQRVAGKINAIQAAAAQLQQARSDLYAGVQSAINTYNRVAGLSDTILGELAQTNAILQDAYQSARAAFTGAVENVDPSDPDFTPINEATYDLISAPADLPDASQTLTTYNRMVTDTVLLTDDTIDAAATKEFALITTFLAIAESTLAAEFDTRSGITAALDRITALYEEILIELDRMQTLYSTGRIDEQYFPQTENYQDVYNLYADVLRYLLSQFFSLNIERRFIIETPRSPLEVTVTEYGGLGDNDENYELFIRSNNLSGNEILLLPAGKEVVVYV